VDATRLDAELHKLIRGCLSNWQRQGKLPDSLPSTAANDVLNAMLHSTRSFRPGTAIGDTLDAEPASYENYREAQAAVCAAAEAAGCAGVGEAANTPGANIGGEVIEFRPPVNDASDCPAATCDESAVQVTLPGEDAKKSKNISYGGHHSRESAVVPVGVPNYPADQEFDEYLEKLRHFHSRERATLHVQVGQTRHLGPVPAGLPPPVVPEHNDSSPCPVP
jgi:hypothetical protein